MAGFVVLAVAAPGWAASPSSGSVGPNDASAGWTGQSYVAGATASPSACGAGGDALCDHFSLSVAATSEYWDTHTGSVRISIAWGSSSNNFDLYVYDGGSLAGSSASGSSTGESVTISEPSGTYSVVVVPKLVTNSGYHGSASFSSQEQAPPPPDPTPSPTGTGGSGNGNGNGNGGQNGSHDGSGPGSGGGNPTPGGGSSPGTGGGNTPSTGDTPAGDTPIVVQPGSEPPFGAPSGPIFTYHGPYHFEPPFSVSDNPGGAVMPPQPPASGSLGGTTSTSTGTGGGHLVQPGGSSGSAGSGASSAGSSAADAGQPVRIRTAGNMPAHRVPSLIWLLLPVGLILLVAVGAVVFERDEDVVRANAVATTTPDGTPSDVPQAPPAGPFVMLGFAVRRLFRRRSAGAD
jgi:hypothetical protein